MPKLMHARGKNPCVFCGYFCQYGQRINVVSRYVIAIAKKWSVAITRTVGLLHFVGNDKFVIGHDRNRYWRLLPILCLCLWLIGCSSQNSTVQPTPTPTRTNTETSLTLFDGVLEGVDEVGRRIWTVSAKRGRYNQEREIGILDNPFGELYQDGKVVYQVTAEKADIEQKGKQLFLRGKIVATDPRNGTVLRGNELEWRPQEDLLLMRNQLNGTHRQMRATAQEARVRTRKEEVDFFGGVVATSVDPSLQIRTEQLKWLIKQEKLIGDRPMQFDRYENNRITDRGRGDRADVNLNTKIVNISKNAQIELANPAMQIVSDSMSWNLQTETVNTNAPVNVWYRTENVRAKADRGLFRIPQRTVVMTGNASAVGAKGQTLRSQEFTWFLDTQIVQARGNVDYRQLEPPMTFKGDTAKGNLQTQNIVVQGGGSNGRVVTDIIPNFPGN